MTPQPAPLCIGLLARMAKAAYDGNPTAFVSGWETVRTFRLGHCFSALFRHPGRNRFVLANRGSDLNLRPEDGAAAVLAFMIWAGVKGVWTR